MNSAEASRVLLVDDQDLVRTGFRLILNTAPDITVAGEAAGGQEALDLLGGGLGVDVICMDVRMPGMDGIETTRAVAAAGMSPKVLVLTTFDVDQYVYDALVAGASGFLLKDCGSTELIAAVRAVHSGESILAPTATTRLLKRFQPHLRDLEPSERRSELLDRLSPREVDVLTAIGNGLTNQEISKQLFMAETTVKGHVGHLFTKLDARDRVQLVIIAYDIGLVTPRR